MNIIEMTIKNFKSIKSLTLHDIEQAMILVGRNSTGKTVVLDAIMAMTGNYMIKESDFLPGGQSVEVAMTLAIQENELQKMHQLGIVSKEKDYEAWLAEFSSRLPLYKDGVIRFTFIAAKNGRIRYSDTVSRDNPYITEILPKIHYIDHSRKIEERFHERAEEFLEKSHHSEIDKDTADCSCNDTDGHKVEHRVQKKVMSSLHDGVQHVRRTHFCSEISEKSEYHQQTENACRDLAVEFTQRRFHSL